ncbi:MAG: RNA 2',3'-cyclic phosphodiesterase [Oscillospiraceae bacterium]|nr:RNA 2',3'-cyclic phosphodiesterase [Oscillospiraceae bacterium]
MRLFIAINFSESVKDKLMDNVGQLRKNCLSGSFTKRDKMHLTLVFLGEQDSSDVPVIRRIIDSAADTQFDLDIGGLGRFKHREGDIYWLAVTDNGELIKLQSRLAEGLGLAGFKLEKREYRPHITLGRRVKPAPGFDVGHLKSSTPPVHAHVHRVSLMSSERRDGGYVYRELYGRELAHA